MAWNVLETHRGLSDWPWPHCFIEMQERGEPQETLRLSVSWVDPADLWPHLVSEKWIPLHSALAFLLAPTGLCWGDTLL